MTTRRTFFAAGPVGAAPGRPRHGHDTATLRKLRERGGNMTELSPMTRDALLRVGTSTLTGILSRRGLRNMFLQDVRPIRLDLPRMVGPAFTMRFIPAREDKAATGRRPVQQQAMEECPPGSVLVVDARGDPRAASVGDIYCGRLKARGCLCVDALSTASKPSSPDRGQAQMMRSVNQPSTPNTGAKVTQAAAFVESSLLYRLAIQELTKVVAAAASTMVSAIIASTPST